MKNFIQLLFGALTLVTFNACSSDDNTVDNSETETYGDLNLTFDAVVGNEDLVLGNTYTINGHSVALNQFRYWISNVVLVNENDESIVIPDSYYLMEETGAISIQEGAYEYPATKRETINLTNLPSGNYKSIEFSVGIDPVYNDNLSLQSGELSQLNGMTNLSWMWHTSYIFTSVKGMDVDTETALQFETGLNDSYRTIAVPFAETVEVGGDHSHGITFKADIAAILEGVDFEATPSVGASTPEAMTVMADNIATKAFTLVEGSHEH